MAKCDICKNKIEEIFLGKIRGTYYKGKVICSECQKKFKDRLDEKLK